MKKCKKCNKTKDQKEFYFHSTKRSLSSRCKSCSRKTDSKRAKERYWENPELARKKNRLNHNTEWHKQYIWKRKVKVLEAYSGKNPRCACCKESNLLFLSIDHIEGGGTKHRIAIGRSSFYPWLIKNNYPKGFRVLCYNCNMALGFFGKCHE